MELRVYGAQVPLVVFGVIALLAALLVTFMPETSRTRLPDTIQVSTYLREPLINLRFVLTYTDNALCLAPGRGAHRQRGQPVVQLQETRGRQTLSLLLQFIIVTISSGVMLLHVDVLILQIKKIF